MPHSSGGGSHSSGSHHSSSHHSSGGGSYSGGSHSSGGGGAARFRRSRTPFSGSHRYVYYRHRKPRYYYSDASDPGVFAPVGMTVVGVLIKLMVFFTAVLPLFLFGIICLVPAFLGNSKITADYNDELIIVDDAEVLGNDTGDLLSAMEALRDQTGVAAAVITVNNESWEDYYSSIANYAYDLYVNSFSDEYHWLIVYSEPETPDADFNDWYWEGMQGDDTDSILTDSVVDGFTDSLQEYLTARTRYTVAEAFAQAFEDATVLCQESPKIDKDLLVPGIWCTLAAVIIVAVMLSSTKRNIEMRAMSKAQRIPEEYKAQPVEIKCDYCDGIYVRGVTQCPHCGAPAKWS